MGLRVEKVTRKNKKVKEVYMDSFPKKERMPYLMMLLMAKKEDTNFLAFYDEDVFCGFVYMARSNNIIFVMFLAVDRNIRSKGYGSKILNEIFSLYPNDKIIISIERCDVDAEDIDIRLRRKDFYLRNGFIESGYLIELEHIKQEIIVKNGQFDKDEFSSFLKKYSNGVMKPPIWKAENHTY